MDTLLDLYSDYLISSFGLTTATGLATLLKGGISHDQVTRFLSGKPHTSADLWKIAKPFVRRIQSEQAVMIVDDSIAEKPYTDENDIEGRYVQVETLVYEANVPMTVYLEGVDFPLLLVKQVFVNEDGSVGILYLVTSDTTLSYDDITTIYQRRWNVEPYHKSLKQNASLEKSPTQTVVTQTNHFFAALCAFIKLEMLKGTTKLNHFALKTKLYVNALQVAFSTLRELQPVHLTA